MARVSPRSPFAVVVSRAPQRVFARLELGGVAASMPGCDRAVVWPVGADLGALVRVVDSHRVVFSRVEDMLQTLYVRELGQGEWVVSNDAALVAGIAPRLTEPNMARVAAYALALDHLDTSTEDFIEGVRIVSPGCELELDPMTGREQVRYCWPERVSQHIGGRSAGHFVATLADVINESDSRAIALSAGSDSPLLASLMVELKDGVRSASMKFDRAKVCDESEDIKMFAPGLGVDASFFNIEDVPVISEDRLGFWGQFLAEGPVAHAGEPHESVFFAKAARAFGVDVITLGVGGDNLFDVPWWLCARDALLRGDLSEASQWYRALGARRARGLFGRWGAVAVAEALLPGALVARRRRGRVREEVSELAHPGWRPGPGLVEGAMAYRELALSTEPGDHARLYMHRSMRHELVARTMSRSAARTGLTFSLPFLAKSVWDQFSVSALSQCSGFLPGSDRIYDKVLLRRALMTRRNLPRRFAWRPKTISFDAHVMRSMVGVGAPIIEELIRGMRLDAAGIIDERVVRREYERIKREARAGENPGVGLVWRVLSCELWLRQLRGEMSS